MKFCKPFFTVNQKSWCVIVINAAQFNSTKPQLWFYVGSISALTMILAGNEVKGLLSVNHTTKKKSSSSLTSSLSSLLILIKIFGIFFSEIKNCYYEIIRKTVSPGKTNKLVSPGESPDKYMMDFILNKVTRISWSRTLPKMSIIPVQHQEFCLYFKSTN